MTQGLKKLYGARALTTDGAEAVMFVDAESAFLRSASVQSIFSSWFARRVIFFDRTIGPPFMDVLEHAAHLVSPGRDPGDFTVNKTKRLNLFGVQRWIVEGDVLAAYFEHVELMHKTAPLSAVLNNFGNQFEIVTVQFFIFLHQNRFPVYHFINYEEILPIYLPGNLARDYLAAHRSDRHHGTGLECYLGHTTPAMAEGLARFTVEYGITLARTECAPHDVLPCIFARAPQLSLSVCSEALPNMTINCSQSKGLVQA